MKNSSASYNLAQNIQTLRKSNAMSQAKLAEVAGVPRTTISHIESGTANPSLDNLCKISAALNVNIEELLAQPRHEVVLIKAKEIPSQNKAGGRVIVKKLMPDKIRGIAIDQIQLEANSTLPGHPHLPGTKEYLMAIKGEMEVYIEGIKYCVKKGDVLAFKGDQRHSYKNTSRTSALAISVVLPTYYQAG